MVQPSPLLVGYVAAFALAAVACFASLTRVSAVEETDTRRGLTALLLTSGGWAAAHVVFLAVPWVEVKLAAYYAGLVIGFAATGAWLYFCSAYTGRTLHRNPFYRRLAVGVFAGVVLVKLTNPIHHLYFTATARTTPFPHLAVEHALFHWVAMGLAYALAAVGYFMLLELFTRTGYDTRPMAVLLGLTALPLGLDLLGLRTTWLLDMTHEPLGVAAFAVGILFVFFERFRAVQLAGDFDDPVIFLDEDGVIRDVNRAAVELFPELSDAVGDALETRLPTVADQLDADERVLELDRDGEPRYYVLSSTPFTLGATPVGRILLIDDVTREERYRRQIERQNERLERFASVISHDLRNPLGVATGRLELEREHRDSENLTAVARALDRIERLIENLLALAHEGQDIGEQATVALAVVAERAWETVDTGDAELVIGAETTFQADADRLQQLLENLFRNAVEHGPTGSRSPTGDAVDPGSTNGPEAGDATEYGEGDVTVTVGAVDGGGFFVADDGPGISPEDREAALEFGHSGADGSGLGLAIVDTIAEAHGWTLTLTDAENGGARFEFTGLESASAAAENSFGDEWDPAEEGA